MSVSIPPADGPGNEGVALLRQGKPAEAAALLRRAVEEAPDTAQWHERLGTALASQGKHEEARACFVRATRLRPDFAEAHHGLGQALRRLVRLDDAEAAYRRALALRPAWADAHNHLGITLLARGRAADASACFRRALRYQPELSEARNNLGVSLADQGKLDEAAAVYEQVLRLRPDSAETHNNLGVIRGKQRQSAAAAACYRKALRLKPDYPDAHNNIGNALRQEGKLTEAVASLREALRLRPAYAEAHNNLAIALLKQGLAEEGLRHYQEALRLKPDYAEAHMNRALAWLVQGDFSRGWPEYEWRVKTRDHGLKSFPQPRWDGRPLEGRPILLQAEQGLGDTLQFIRYARLVRERGGSVVLECPRPLLALLSRCADVAQLVPQGEPLPEFLTHAPLLSLPGIFGTTLENVPAAVPYLFPDPTLVERWRAELGGGDGLKIGIAWQGSPKYQDDRLRSLPLASFEPLARLPGVKLFSLQKGFGSEQLAAVAGPWGVVDLGSRLDQSGGAFTDTAAVMQHLDLVVTSDTALAHLAGGLGVPVWVALGKAADWRWLLDREDCPWYPTMRLFRQQQWGDWRGVFARIAREVQARGQQPAAPPDPMRQARELLARQSAERGLRLFKEGKSEEGITCLRLALRLDPDAPRTHNNLGVLLASQGGWAEAAGCYREALRLLPDYAEAHNNLGDALQNQGKTEEAAACFHTAVRLKPHAAEAQYNLGVALAGQGKLAEASACLQEALRLRPGFAVAESRLRAAREELAKRPPAPETPAATADAYNRLGSKRLREGKAAEAEAAFRRALQIDPADAEAHNHLGTSLERQGKAEEALACYREAVRLRPEHGDAQHNLANALRRSGQLAEAEAAYQPALRLQPGSADVRNHLGITLLAQARLNEAAACFREALRLKPHHAEAHNNLGVAFEQQGKLDEAIACYQRSLKAKPNAPDTHKNLALTWLLHGNFEQGWAEYEWRWKCAHNPVRDFGAPRWDGGPLDGRPILLHAEQGLGDTLHFVRYAALVRQRGGTVLLECQPPLEPLLARCPDVSRVIPRGAPLPEVAAHAPLLSLPAIFRTTLADVPAAVPYLCPDPARVEKWRAEFEGVAALKVGIAWQGSKKYQGDRHRSIPLAHFEPLARLSGVRLYSLQKGFGSEQLAEVAESWGVTDLGPRLDETGGAFMDTAAVLQHLDLLVTSDSAIVHLAGALGVRVWMALPQARDWRWLVSGDESPWYPTMRLFRQDKWGDWDGVFARIAEALDGMRPIRRARQPVRVEVPPGELIDKITILEIKRDRIGDPGQLSHVRIELGALAAARARCLRPGAELDRLTAELKAVNEALWEVEDEIRGHEQRQDFGRRFIELARSVYHQNDRRAQIKRRINDLLGSALVEEKSYAPYQTPACRLPLFAEREPVAAR